MPLAEELEHHPRTHGDHMPRTYTHPATVGNGRAIVARPDDLHGWVGRYVSGPVAPDALAGPLHQAGPARVAMLLDLEDAGARLTLAGAPSSIVMHGGARPTDRTHDVRWLYLMGPGALEVRAAGAHPSLETVAHVPYGIDVDALDWLELARRARLVRTA